MKIVTNTFFGAKLNDNKGEEKNPQKRFSRRAEQRMLYMKNYHAYFTRLLTWHRWKGHWHSLLSSQFPFCSGENDLDILLFIIVHADEQSKLIIIMLYEVKLCWTCGSWVSITTSTIKFHSTCYYFLLLAAVPFCLNVVASPIMWWEGREWERRNKTTTNS